MKKSSLFVTLLILSACEGALRDEALVQGGQAGQLASESTERKLIALKGRLGAAERSLLAQHRARIRKQMPGLNVIAAELPAREAEALAHSPMVDYVETDEFRMPMGLASSQITPALNNGLYGLLTTKVVDVHARGVTGSGIKVGIADTGLDYTHPDIAPVYAGGIDTVSDDSDPWWNNDPYETHGTHVAGIISAANNTSGVIGTAYGVQLYHARVLGPSGGYASDILEGVLWLVETAGCKIINLSLGGGSYSRTEERFARELRKRGVLVIAASGNEAAREVSYPAGYAANVAVGAVDVNNDLAYFSNTGKNLDIVGPGVSVLSSVPAGTGTAASVSTTSSFTALALAYSGQTSGLSRVLVDCGLGQPGECPSTVAGNIALIQRGSISLADKVANAMSQGAVAAIIYNNTKGDFQDTLGATTTRDGRAWIPAVSVSDMTGATLKSQAGSNATVLNNASSWDHYSGTSMATPYVAGVAALVWSSNPTLSNLQVERLLFNTAQDLGASGYETTFGHGLVNADAAVRAASRRGGGAKP